MDSQSKELARIWAAGGKLHVSLATDMWDDPAAWGIMLVDIARHVSRAYKQTKGPDPEDVLARIRAGFDAEWTAETDKPEGGVAE